MSIISPLLCCVYFRNALYSLDEIKEILLLCESYQLEVIPLVQTFGHLEVSNSINLVLLQ